MRYAKRLAVLAAAVAMTLAGGAPADAATTVTTMEISGTINASSGLSSGGTVTVNGSCVHATVVAQPSAGAGTCGLSTAGRGSGNCTLWSALVTGTLTPTLVVGSYPSYSVQLLVSSNGGALTITGNARDASGAIRTVVGSGVAVQNPSTGAGCGGPFSLHWAGTLSIAG